MGKRGRKPKELVMTQQHLDVLHLMALGNTDKEIADITGYGYHPTRERLREVRKLLGARNAAHAAAIAVRDGLVSGGAA